MRVFQIVLVIAWLVLMVVTVRAFDQLGPNAGNVFFGDFAHPWRAQFLADFSLHILLMSVWMIYREPRLWVGIVCAFFSIMGGGVFTLAYILVASVRAHGNSRQLLLGKHA
jgi:hypothetical protein